MTDAFYAINATVGLAAIVVVTVAVFCGGHALVHRAFPKTQFIEHNEVAGFIVAIVGVLYAVLLAFVTVIVWEHYDQSEDRARNEVEASTDIWRLSRHLPSPSAGRVRDDVARYATSVFSDEWPEMRRGGASRPTQRAIVALIDDIASFDAHGARESNVQQRLLDRVQVVADLRRHRIYDTTSGVPRLLWVGLIVGAATVAGFVFLFGMSNFRVQLLMTGAVAIMIGLSLGTILELDYPFRGTVSVSAERWELLAATMAHDR